MQTHIDLFAGASGFGSGPFACATLETATVAGLQRRGVLPGTPFLRRGRHLHPDRPSPLGCVERDAACCRTLRVNRDAAAAHLDGMCGGDVAIGTHERCCRTNLTACVGIRGTRSVGKEGRDGES